MASATSFYDFKPLDSKSARPTAAQRDPSSAPPHQPPRDPLVPVKKRSVLTLGAERGQEVNLGDYKGKVVLLINTASKCGFTPQYEGLQSLYTKLREKHGDDVVFLGFPCNQFAGQEPASNDEIQNFCLVNYGVNFPIMAKVDVNGDGADPLWTWLKEQQPGILGLKRVKWNFEKFLVGRDGKVKGRWASTTKPESLEEPILAELASKDAAASNL